MPAASVESSTRKSAVSTGKSAALFYFLQFLDFDVVCLFDRFRFDSLPGILYPVPGTVFGFDVVCLIDRFDSL